jgi:ABC-type branched-subunit amino acid transport system substrate-binding protein
MRAFLSRTPFLLLACIELATGCNEITGLGRFYVANSTGGGISDDSSPGLSDAPNNSSGDATSASSDDASTDSADGWTPPECTRNDECTARATAEGPLEAGVVRADAGSTQAPYQETLDGGVVPAVCLKSVGKCARLLSADCRSFIGDYRNDDAILIGTFFATTGPTGAANSSREQSAILAAEELNSSIAGGGLPPATDGGMVRPLLVLQCDAASDPLRVARHLVDDLHVPAVVGPNAGQDVVDVTQQVSAKGGMLLMSPTVLSSSVSNLVDNGLTWRNVPSDEQRAKLVITQINDIEAALHATRGNTLKLGIVYRTDALGLSARDSISGKLSFNGKFISDPANAAYVSLDHYDDLNDIPSQTAIATKYATFRPDIVFVTVNEIVANIVMPLERALMSADAGANLPYYVGNDASKVKTWLTGAIATNVTADFRSRVRGIGVRPDGNSAPVFAAFNTAFLSRYGSNPGTAGMATSYDAMYSIAYAIAAAGNVPISGDRVAKGLRSLASGDIINVGQAQASLAFQRLSAGSSIALRGTFSPMQWDFNGDVVSGTVEVWCVGLAGGTASFGSSGVTMDISTQIVGGTYTQCN